MTTVMGLMHFTYDMSDQPVAMTGDAPNTRKNIDASYLYDGNMKRVRSIIDSGDGNGPKTIYNVYDAAGRLVHVDEEGGGETDYLHGMGQTLARIKDDGNGDVFTYLHPDHLGSPQLGTKGQGFPLNEQGEVDFEEHYTPFGEALLNPAANDNQSGFTGHIKYKGTGLNYMQARYYDPNIGRFLSIDPMDFLGSGGDPRYFNRYSYTFNDPINNIDPDGMQVVQDGVLKVTVSGGISLTGGYKGGDSGPGAIGVGADAAVEIGIGLPSSERGIPVPMTGGFVTVDAIGVTETVVDSDSFQGATLDSDIGELGISLGDIDDRSGVADTIEADGGVFGGEATSNGNLAGSTVKGSIFGPGGGASVSKTETSVVGEVRFDEKEGR